MPAFTKDRRVGSKLRRKSAQPTRAPLGWLMADSPETGFDGGPRGRDAMARQVNRVIVPQRRQRGNPFVRDHLVCFSLDRRSLAREAGGRSIRWPYLSPASTLSVNQPTKPSGIEPLPPRQPFLLEIAVASIEDAQTAQTGHADRLELNTALSLGGLTPSLGALLEVRQASRLPLLVMLRPRPSGFCYSRAEFRVLLRDLDLVLSHGADGIVFGILNEDATVDAVRCREVVRQAGRHPVVFHRAFDLTPEPAEALEVLIDLGIRRVMTSGQQPTALAGASCIAGLVRQAAGRIEILPAGGITSSNVSRLLERTGCTQVHAGLRGERRDLSAGNRPEIAFARSLAAPDVYETTELAAVRALRHTLDTWRPSQRW
ncbi:MAG TPA: copper homeostasis protein CutC [Gemmataceae bacterium]|nr:copper homeostasis protein CutC [Gemmataceae bacterium]